MEPIQARSAATRESSGLSPSIKRKPEFSRVPGLLKWAGGKRWLVPILREHWLRHSNRRLVEPLCGGLAVALGLRPNRALLNDINPHAINFYRWVKSGLRTRIRMENDRAFYSKSRTRFNRLVERGKSHTREAAVLFYYLNRTGYNGLCRFNKRGEFNVPFGRYDAINYKNNFLDYKPLLSSWDFSNKDFRELKFHPTDFIYADPPYDVQFRQYSREGFSWEDQEDLAKRLATHPGPVVLSNQATDRIICLYEKLGFELEYLHGPRMISCTGDRSPAPEVLATRGLRKVAKA